MVSGLDLGLRKGLIGSPGLGVACSQAFQMASLFLPGQWSLAASWGEVAIFH